MKVMKKLLEIPLFILTDRFNLHYWLEVLRTLLKIRRFSKLKRPNAFFFSFYSTAKNNLVQVQDYRRNILLLRVFT